MFEHTDQLYHTLRLKQKPRRIISVVPSQSEFLWEIGLREELVGITKFCIHPHSMYTSAVRVGGTKNLDIEKIRALKPDLIIGNKEENDKTQIELLQNEFNVWMSDIYTVDDAFEMMRRLGVIFEKEAQAQQLVNRISASLTRIKNSLPKLRTAYFIWNDPYMCAAKHTFIDHVLNYLGLENALAELERYPELSDEQLKEINPQLCFLSSEPFPFKEKHINELQQKLPETKVMIVDGEVFSWYGSRLQHLEGYIQELRSKLL